MEPPDLYTRVPKLTPDAIERLNAVAKRAAAAIKDGQDLQQLPAAIREANQSKKKLTQRLAKKK